MLLFMRLPYPTVLGLMLFLTTIAKSEPVATSADERSKMKVYAGAEGGSAIVPFATGGAVLGAYVGQDWLINANYTEGSADVDNVDLKWNYTEVRAKRFFGNSLFVNFGVGQRRYEFDMDATQIGGGEDVHLEAESMNSGLSLSVGNQWQWRNVSVGCEWLGAYIPFARHSSAPQSQASADADDQKTFRDLFDELAEKPHLSALRVQLGLSF